MKNGAMVAQREIVDARLREKTIGDKIRVTIGLHFLLVKIEMQKHLVSTLFLNNICQIEILLKLGRKNKAKKLLIRIFFHNRLPFRTQR